MLNYLYKIFNKATRKPKTERVQMRISENADPIEEFKEMKEILNLFSKEIGNFRLKVDQFFRICDEKMARRVKIDRFIEQARNMGIRLKEEGEKKLMKLLNWGDNGEITYEQIVEIWDAFGIEVEGTDGQIRERVMRKIAAIMEKQEEKEQQELWKDKETISLKDLLKYVDGKISLKRLERYALMNIWDQDGKNAIKREFVWRLMKRYQKNENENMVSIRNKFKYSFENAIKKSSKQLKGGRKQRMLSESKRNNIPFKNSINLTLNAKSVILDSLTCSSLLYFQTNCSWYSSTFVSFNEFYEKWKQCFPSIPANSLKDLFDEFDIMGNGKIKIINLWNELDRLREKTAKGVKMISDAVRSNNSRYSLLKASPSNNLKFNKIDSKLFKAIERNKHKISSSRDQSKDSEDMIYKFESNRDDNLKRLKWTRLYSDVSKEETKEKI